MSENFSGLLKTISKFSEAEHKLNIKFGYITYIKFPLLGTLKTISIVYASILTVL